MESADMMMYCDDDDHKVLQRTEASEGDERMVTNHSGGRTFAVTWVTYLMRYLILGSQDSMYVTSAVSKIEDAEFLREHLHGVENVEKWRTALNLVRSVSLNGRAPKQEPTMIVLAHLWIATPSTADGGCGGGGGDGAREDAELMEKTVLQLCRIPTHLFMWIGFVEAISKKTTKLSSTGWGRRMRRVVSTWYLSRSPMDLAFTCTKYRNREGWTHRDVLRLCHPVPVETAPQQHAVLHFLTKGTLVGVSADAASAMEDVETTTKTTTSKKRSLKLAPPVLAEDDEVRKFLEAFQFTSSAAAVAVTDADSKEGVDRVAQLVQEFRLGWEHLDTGYLKHEAVWDVLVKQMPIGAMIRNLGKMSTFGGFMDRHGERIVSVLTNQDVVSKSRIHPLQVLNAIYTYENGHGVKGSLQWTVNKRIATALNTTFALAFKNVAPTGKRIMLAIDVSRSMGCAGIAGSSMTARDASAALGLLLMQREPNVDSIVAFSRGVLDMTNTFKENTQAAEAAANNTVTLFDEHVEQIRYGENISPLRRIIKSISGLPFDTTDCSLPMIYAAERRKEIDTFIVITDNETNRNEIDPHVALKKYREQMGIPEAQLVVMAVSTTKFTIADPSDPGMLDIVGFDSSCFEILQQFMLGTI